MLLEILPVSLAQLLNSFILLSGELNKHFYLAALIDFLSPTNYL